MSSSEPGAAGRRFLTVLFTAFAVMLGGTIAATALVDPTGLLVGTGWRQGVCAAGLKDAQDPAFMSARTRLFQPEEIIVGSSRVMRGFEHDGFGAGDGASATSLGFTSAHMIDIDGIVRDAVADAPIERVWIGLDFGAFILTDRARYPAQASKTLPALRRDAVAMGLFSPEALQATLNVLLHPGLCRTPPYDARGFTHPDAPLLSSSERAVLPDEAARARTLATWHQGVAHRETLYRSELDRFGRLLVDLKRRDIGVVLYLGPTHPAYDSLVDEAGLSELRVQWRADIARIAGAQGAILVAADRPGFLATLPDLPSGCGTAPADCAFYDATHFRPIVGAAIVREGRRLAATPGPVG